MSGQVGARLFVPQPKHSVTSLPAGESTTSPALQRGIEIAALLLWAASLFLLLALASYRHDPNDPAVAGPDWVGPVGAASAGFLVRGFGIVSWLFPLELFLFALSLVRGRKAEPLGYRLTGDLLICLVLSALVEVAAPGYTVFGRMKAGGNVGLLFGGLMEGLFSTAGSFLVGGTLVGLVLVGRSRFSFLRLCSLFGQVALVTGAHLQKGGHRVLAAWKQARLMARRRRESQCEKEASSIQPPRTDEAIVAELHPTDSELSAPDDPGLDLEFAPDARDQDPPTEAPGDGLLEALVGLESSRTGCESAGPEPEPGPFCGQRQRSNTRAPHRKQMAASRRERVSTRPASSPEEPDASASASSRVSEDRRRPGRGHASPHIVDTRPGQATEGSSRRLDSGSGTRFRLPPTNLLESPPPELCPIDESALRENARLLEKTLADYGVSARVVDIRPGPTVTTFEAIPEAGTKVSKVAGLVDDLALALSRKVRIIAPIPGKSRIGFEVPNHHRPRVYLRDLVEHREFVRLASERALPVVLGRDIVGTPFYADLAAMPHVIVAGATGAGKSVGLNVMLASLLFCRTPEQLRLLMVDPKVVELAPFDGIPHLLLPVVTDTRQAATALRWALDEMERRYQLFADAGTRNISTYNAWVDRVLSGELEPPDPARVRALGPEGGVVSVPVARTGSDGVLLPGRLPWIVIVVDEFADLMIQQGKEVEACVARLAQKARAAGMHLVLATQRPSVDVITGMIKANFPSRIAFRVAQRVDSRTILDEQGAELLLGKGDMLVKLNAMPDTLRVQCPFISEEEVGALTNFWRAQGEPEYHEAILQHDQEQQDPEQEPEAVDPMFEEAVRVVALTRRCSTSWLQRKLGVGYNRAAKMVELMEKRGLVGPPSGAKDREVLIDPP